MMKRLTIILFTLLIVIQNINAIDKAISQPIDSLQARSLRTSDLIFLGKLFKIDTILNTMSFNVIEVFKGNPYKKNLKIKWEKHTRIIDADKSLWIVYANQISDSAIILNINGLTRSNVHPETTWAYVIPPPPPPNKIDQFEFIYYNNLWIDFKLNAYKDWQAEVELLRKYKELNITPIQDHTAVYKIYFFISIVFNIITICLLIYLIPKCKKAYR